MLIAVSVACVVFARRLSLPALYVAAFAVFVAASGVCAALYSLPFEAVLYPALLVAAFAVVTAILDISRTARRHGALSALRALPDDLSDYLPEPDTIAEEDLSEIIRRLEDRISRLTDDFSRRESDTINYYTMWAHQIKAAATERKPFTSGTTELALSL